MKYLPILLVLLALVYSCGQRKDANGKVINFDLEGTVKGAPKQKIYIEAISAEGTIKVAEGEFEKDGEFELAGNIPGMGIYQMRLGDESAQKIIPLTLMPGDKVTIKADYNTFTTSPTFSGTEWAAPLTKFMALYNEFTTNQRSLVDLQTNGASENDLLEKYNEMRKPLDNFAKSVMKKTPSNPVNVILSSSLSPNVGFDAWDPANLEILRGVSKAFEERFKDSPITKNMANQLAQIEMAYNQHLNGTDTEVAPTAAEMAPEIVSKNPEGKTIRLSDLKGKFVLIDFWASWCGPCRKENPNVVRMYNEYKNKDFTILSVSLDDNPTAWQQAILADGLIWPYHVSDLKKWETPLLQTYNFNSIPHTVLVDKTGKIIARNLRGASLEQKLKELL